MTIIGMVIALILAASIAYGTVSAIRDTEVAPAVPRHFINRAQTVLSEPNARTSDRERLRRYFLEGRPDGLRRVFP